jgi:hypothetical protein
MDCSAVPVAERNGPKCNLDCRNGLVKTSLGGGVYRCL